MHRNTLFVCLLTSMVSLVKVDTYAQPAEPALARVIYEFTHINDTLQPDKPHKEEMVLYIGQYASYYTTFSSERVNQQLKKQIEDPAFDGNLTITGGGRTTRESYYARPAQQAFKQVYLLVGTPYLLDEPYPEIAWEVTDETQEIGGYQAQRANGRFKGRDYTAWFTADVPFQAGPWKLLGLPGLVLEAVDGSGQVMFRYAGFETLPESETTVGVPEHVIETKKKALDRLIAAHKKDPQAFMTAQAKAGAPSGRSSGGSLGDIDPSRIKSINVTRDTSQTSSVDNNPLELTDR